MQPGQKPTIVIDNGSYEARAGWSFEQTPFLRFRNLVAKPKTSVNKAIDAMHLVGDEMNEFDNSKVSRRSMFDKNVVFHIQSLEHMLDYTFSHLGLQNDSSIDFPILFTEPLCNPNYSRGLVSELLFECYNVPALSYANDSLLSFYYNTQNLNGCSVAARSGIIVDSSHQTTHIIPVIDGQWQLPLTKRIGLGGLNHQELLGKSLSLKYPQHKNQLTFNVIQEIQENHTYCAENYRAQIKFLEVQYNTEKELVLKEEEERRRRLLGNQANPEEESKEIPKPLSHMPKVVYKSRTDFLISKLEAKDDGIDYEDHII